MNIILATSSPRRKALFSDLNIPFSMCPSHIDENIEQGQLSSPEYAQELALMKAQAILSVNSNTEEGLIIGADTIVCINGHILGKPIDKEDAFQMLKMLSNQWHEVITGLAFISCTTPSQPIKAFEKTKIKMKPLSDEDINSYIETGEPFDKAGSYAIQGKAAKFIEKSEGCYTNVVGFPIPLIKKILKENFKIL